MVECSTAPHLYIYNFPELLFLHLFTELFHKNSSSIIRIHDSTKRHHICDTSEILESAACGSVAF